MRNNLKVLMLEDSEADAHLLLRELRRGGFEVTHLRVESVEDFRAALREEPWDVVISDYTLPRGGGLEALQVVRDAGLDLPFILVSGVIGEELAVEAMRAGAHDFVLKDRIARLVPAIRRELGEAESRRRGREAEEALRLSQQRYEELVNSVDGIVWEADPDTLRFTFVSPQAERLIGYPPEVWLREANFWSRRIHPHYLEWCLSRRKQGVAERRDHEIEYPLIARDGGIVWIKDLATVVAGSGGGVRLRGIMVDATNFKRVEEALLQRIDEVSVLNQLLDAQRAELSTYHGMLTHDISNFAMVILGVVERLLAQAEGPLAPKQEELLRRANRQAFEMNRLADNARLLLRLRERGMPAAQEPVSVATALRRAVETVRILHFDRPFECVSECPEALRIQGVPLLDNVFLNLIDNAVRHSPRGPRPRLDLRADTANGNVVITIRGGAPPPPELLSHLFEREMKGRRSTGHGMGLSLVREIVERAGGKIQARTVGEEDEPVFEVQLSLPRAVHGAHSHP